MVELHSCKFFRHRDLNIVLLSTVETEGFHGNVNCISFTR